MTFLKCLLYSTDSQHAKYIVNKKLAYILNIPQYFYKAYSYIKKERIFAGVDE